MATPPYTDVITTDHDKQILSSARLWEHRTLVILDDVSPDMLPDLVREANRDLLAESSRAGVALDWFTFKVHIAVHSLGEGHLVVRVDVL